MGGGGGGGGPGASATGAQARAPRRAHCAGPATPGHGHRRRHRERLQWPESSLNPVSSRGAGRLTTCSTRTRSVCSCSLYCCSCCIAVGLLSPPAGGGCAVGCGCCGCCCMRAAQRGATTLQRWLPAAAAAWSAQRPCAAHAGAAHSVCTLAGPLRHRSDDRGTVQPLIAAHKFVTGAWCCKNAVQQSGALLARDLAVYAPDCYTTNIMQLCK